MTATNARRSGSTVGRVWHLVRYRPWLSAAYLGVWIIVYVMELAPRLTTKWFFDTISGDAPLRFGVAGVIALVLLTRAFHILTIGTGAVVGAWQRFCVSALMRRNLLARILERPGARALPGSPGEALNTLRDDVGEIENVMSWLADQVAILIYSLIAMGLLLRIDPQIALLSLLPLVVVILVSRTVASRAERYRKANREATARANGALVELLGGVQAIKVGCAEEHATAHLAALGDVRQHAVVRDRALNQLIISLCEEAGTLTTGMVLLLGAGRMRAGNLTLGDFALLVTCLDSITMFIVESGGFTAYFKQVGVAFERVSALMRGDASEMSVEEAGDRLVAHAPTYLSGPLPDPPVVARTEKDRLESLRVEGLCYRYPTERPPHGAVDGAARFALQGIDLQLRRGDFVVITGRVASGKTTLLRALLGLLPAYAGAIHWNGERVDDPTSFFRPPRSAYAAQIPHLFSETLRENILMGLVADDDALAQAIRLAALQQDVADMPEGLDTLIGPRGVRLSGGQRQRTAAARMFVRQPELLVFDDLSSALDVETEQALWQGVSERMKDGRGVTCLVVSHRRAALQRADQIILLEDGRVAARGRLDALLAENETIRAIWGEG